MFVYYSTAQVRDRNFQGPDVFAVLDVPRGERKSWVLWEEGKRPDVVIELLSDSTAQRDKTEKKQLYQNCLRVTEYFWGELAEQAQQRAQSERQRTQSERQRADRLAERLRAMGVELDE